MYSGVFSFEIADVSMPRRLAGRPANRPEDGTLLVLPFRHGPDGERARQLYQRALAFTRDRGYSSVDELVAHLIEAALAEHEQQDQAAVEERLKGLGYIE